MFFRLFRSPELPRPVIALKEMQESGKMKIRRWFILQMAILPGMLLPGQPSWAVGKKSDGTDYGTAAHSRTIVDRLADRTLQELRDFHQRKLDEG